MGSTYRPERNAGMHNLSVAINTTLSNINTLVEVTTGASNKTIKLNTSPSNGRHYIIKKIDSGAGNVIIDGNGKTIDGSASFSLKFENEALSVRYDGTNYVIS